MIGLRWGEPNSTNGETRKDPNLRFAGRQRPLHRFNDGLKRKQGRSMTGRVSVHRRKVAQLPKIALGRFCAILKHGLKRVSSGLHFCERFADGVARKN